MNTELKGFFFLNLHAAVADLQTCKLPQGELGVYQPTGACKRTARHRFCSKRLNAVQIRGSES